ncbi:hypothetical protein [Streptomyces albipurpureus]|uniref:Uncharacterized protein n=1 Tax=Streptomyces albipurpureus TaxID=2897419 RepID=A0ABT0UTM0_9ACTN|nr:hypothetical protein [Streptomyces sp. CWNU-1]MCM2391908.1 hypothetical protein [Streptomyces sp. CWNU-1]
MLPNSDPVPARAGTGRATVTARLIDAVRAGANCAAALPQHTPADVVDGWGPGR